MSAGALSLVNCDKEVEWKWKIECFSLRKEGYTSPPFKFEGEYWHLSLYPYYNNKDNGCILLRLRRLSGDPDCSPIDAEFSVSLKTIEGSKSFERRQRYCFVGWGVYEFQQWISISELSNRQREFLPSGCLTILLTMKKAESEKETETVSAASASSSSKYILRGDEISLHKKFLDKVVKCPECDEVFSLKNWFEHECQMINAKAGSSAVACSCSKRSLHGNGISFHKDSLNKAAKRLRCDDIVNLQNCRHHEYQMTNIKAVTSTTELSMICGHYKILQDLKQLLFNQEQTDVILRVKGKEFAAHKAILAARSPVFASTFRHEMNENKTGIVDIEDCDPSVFPDFLRFLYCNDTSNLSGENVFILFTIADKYQCEDLRVKCVRFIKDNLTVKTFCKAVALALLHSEANLLRLAADFFIENAGKIVVTIDWQTFVAENPTYSNELFIKYVNSKTRSNS